ncbi:hypothetical protein EV177_005687 [Coemansia sp. RSA 1804]|nr:hypothetical protein EV177_005687 [Coemansia sp. RSA 1804]
MATMKISSGDGGQTVRVEDVAAALDAIMQITLDTLAKSMMRAYPTSLPPLISRLSPDAQTPAVSCLPICRLPDHHWSILRLPLPGLKPTETSSNVCRRLCTVLVLVPAPEAADAGPGARRGNSNRSGLVAAT